MNQNAVFDRRYKPTKKQRSEFQLALKYERQFAARLNKIAAQIGQIIHANWELSIDAMNRVKDMLNKYAKLIEPWAKAVVHRMHVELNARNLKAWEDYAAGLNIVLQKEVHETPVDTLFRQLMASQVKLITSLPLEAAQRVHEYTIAGLTGEVPEETVYDMIMRTGLVTKSRATLIARTETARTQSNLTQARARTLGSTHYIWRTVKDGRVRESHRKLEGTIQRWDSPPLCDAPDHHAHPGCIWNCRCWAQPILIVE